MCPSRCQPLLLILVAVVVGQEMPGKGMGCSDKQELCSLNCLLPSAGTMDLSGVTVTRDDLNSCLDVCDKDLTQCKDTPDNTKYIDCATVCAKTYDVALNACLQAASATTVGTYGTSQDACANLAAAPMDECMSACFYGADAAQDRYGAWSPEREAGHRIASLPRGQFRRPFRDPDVVYGRDFRDARAVSGGVTVEVAAAAAEPAQLAAAQAAVASDAEEDLSLLWINLAVLAAALALAALATLRCARRSGRPAAAARIVGFREQRRRRQRATYGAFDGGGKHHY
ncbi:hypothetical protein JKP88DRAFT_208773 [Tribonema minus]|uniref:Uncharacterized protein n=1 Tax=Tribonema minus TaxID=303371 RepID=A0A835YM51_9STRA|nr:hypothetical protein JKP88DRAFT_202788 [Tribonema minus]KAG5180726.1 hypothetical protein JKP88DRAFT_208773 [Tribonema minus]